MPKEVDASRSSSRPARSSIIISAWKTFLPIGHVQPGFPLTLGIAMRRPNVSSISFLYFSWDFQHVNALSISGAACRKTGGKATYLVYYQLRETCQRISKFYRLHRNPFLFYRNIIHKTDKMVRKRRGSAEHAGTRWAIRARLKERFDKTRLLGLVDHEVLSHDFIPFPSLPTPIPSPMP